VIDRGYLPFARVLARSLAEHHPDVRLQVLMVDADGSEGDEPFDVLAPEALGIAPRELHRRAALFDTQGLISSLRPLLIGHLLAAGGSVLLLDVDMEVLAPLDDVWALAATAGVVLSPHAIAPVAGRPGAWPEEDLLRGGTFNGGLLGVGPGGAPFAAWLAERTARDCLRDPARGLLYSQTWLNLVPALFGHAILRDAGVNAMVHNLRGLDLTWAGDEPSVAGTPLRLFHYSGFDAADPAQLSRHYPGETATHDARPGLARLLERYAGRLRAHGWPQPPSARWSTLPGGLRLDPVARAAYRDALLAAEAGDGEEPPDPFGPPGALVAWLRAPGADGVPRYLARMRATRPDLAAAFPAVPGGDQAAFLAWAAGSTEVPLAVVAGLSAS
jgi:hypothetical protein